MHVQASRQQFTDFQLQGAYPELQQLVGLHRFCKELKLSGPRRNSAQQAGEWQSRRRGRGVDFDEVRPYQAGDDIRSIDWRVTARTQKPHTKLYREEQERPVLLAADLRSSMFFGSQSCFKSVLCSALISSLAWIGLANRDRIGGLVFGDQQHRDIRPKRSKHAALELIQQLQKFAARLDSPCPTQPPQSLQMMLEKLLPVCRPGTGLYIASDFHDLDDRCFKLLYQLSRHADLTLFMLYDPLEQQLPHNDQLWVTDGRQRQRLSDHSNRQGRIDGRIDDGRNDSLIDSRIATLQSGCNRLGIKLVTLTTDSPLLDRLNGLYGSAGSRSKRSGAGV